MKPNLLVIHASGSEPSPLVETLCNQWMEDSYVYLLCPGCGFREDNEHGVRFLSQNVDALPHFGHLEAVVAFEESAALDRLRERYPDLLVRVISSALEALPDQEVHAVREHFHRRQAEPLAA